MPATIERTGSDRLRVVLPVAPVPASRPRVTSRGLAYYAGPYKVFQKRLKELLPPSACCFTGELLVEVECVCKPIVKSKFSTPMGDCDNLAKGPIDALKDRGFFGDDRQIIDLHVIKRFPKRLEQPHIVVSIQEV